ncbi:MAG: hypothetical protein ABIJ48_02365 [Actinomycetota bacterium]
MGNGPVSPAAARPHGDRWAARRRVLIPVLIALTSVLGAVGAWRASAASGAASGAERRAFADTVAAEQQRAAIETVVGSIEFGYARRLALQESAAALRAEAEASGPDEAARLIALAAAQEASAAAYVIDADALRPDGSLNVEAKREVEWGLASDLQDLDPGPEMARAADLRAKSQRLVGLTAFLIAAALFLTLAEVSRHPRPAALYWHGGVTVLAVAAVLLIIVEAL